VRRTDGASLRKTAATASGCEARRSVPKSGTQPYAWEKTAELIVEMHELLQDRQIQLLVMFFPMVDQMNPEFRDTAGDYLLYPQGRLVTSANDAAPYLDLTEALYRAGGAQLFSDSVHITQGNDIVEVEVARFLFQQVLDAVPFNQER
jgi:hypothetical protein